MGFIIIHHCSQEFALQIHIYDPGNSASLRQRPKTPENLFYPFTSPAYDINNLFCVRWPSGKAQGFEARPCQTLSGCAQVRAGARTLPAAFRIPARRSVVVLVAWFVVTSPTVRTDSSFIEACNNIMHGPCRMLLGCPSPTSCRERSQMRISLFVILLVHLRTCWPQVAISTEGWESSDAWIE